MVTHSSILAWRIPWTEEPGRLQSIESQRVRHDWSNLAFTHNLIIPALDFILLSIWVLYSIFPHTISLLPGILQESQLCTIKNPPSMQETQEKQVWSLGQEDSLKKEMATHYSTLAWKIPWTEEPGGLPSMRSERVTRNWATEHACTSRTHEGKYFDCSYILTLVLFQSWCLWLKPDSTFLSFYFGI